MNRLNRNFYTLLLSVTVSVVPCMYSTQGKLKDDAVCSSIRLGCKKYSTHIAVATATTIIVVYTIAVYMNKISSPVALWKALILPLVVTSKNKLDRYNQKNSGKENILSINGNKDKDNVLHLKTSEDIEQKGVKKLYQVVENGVQGITKSSEDTIRQMEVNGGEGYLQ